MSSRFPNPFTCLFLVNSIKWEVHSLFDLDSLDSPLFLYYEMGEKTQFYQICFLLANFFKKVLAPEFPEMDSLIRKLRVKWQSKFLKIRNGYFQLWNLYFKLELRGFNTLIFSSKQSSSGTSGDSSFLKKLASQKHICYY